MQQVQPTKDLDRALHDLEEFGLALVQDALDADETREVRRRLVAAIERSHELGVPTRGYELVDPNDRNHRVFNLFNLDPIFIDLIQRPVALRFVRQFLGERFLISNFTANITAPGSESMALHSDQMASMPPPWPIPLAINVAWCLDDCTNQNGATRYVPGSHRATHAGPEFGRAYTTWPIEAPAGTAMVMDGRLWHTSGVNRTQNEERAVLFGYYVAPHLRPQINWNAALLPEVVDTLSDEFLDWLGYRWGNVETLIPYTPLRPSRTP